MKAAVVSDFEQAPRYTDFDTPSARAGEWLVQVHAAALSQLVKAQASGKHYSSGTVPFVPGADGVGRLADGRRVYFAFPRAPYGSMAEHSVAAPASCIELPADLDDVTAAAIANPGMSSWAALERAGFHAGETVLIHGATGASGRVAVQVARHLGARKIIATGRNEKTLAALNADRVIALNEEPAELSAAFRRIVSDGLDVVLDYLSGPTAQQLVAAFINAGPHRVRYVQIGSLAGHLLTLPVAALRSSGLELLGSGIGSLPPARLLSAIRGVLYAVGPARMTIATEAVALADVENAWRRSTDARLVFTLPHAS